MILIMSAMCGNMQLSNSPGHGETPLQKFSLVVLAAALLAGPALAQDSHSQHGTVMHGSQTAPMAQGGEAAFAAIQEVVGVLEADASTDWSKVNIEALRRHLVDMNNVTLRSVVQATEQGRTVTFVVTGKDEVVGSIQRMVTAHAGAMNGSNGWSYEGVPIDGGARMRVTAPDDRSLMKLRALGFIGVMTQGMHHQAHHLMIARGMAPHH
jgi:hypothetical protein